MPLPSLALPNSLLLTRPLCSELLLSPRRVLGVPSKETGGNRSVLQGASLGCWGSEGSAVWGGRGLPCFSLTSNFPEAARSEPGGEDGVLHRGSSHEVGSSPQTQKAPALFLRRLEFSNPPLEASFQVSSEGPGAGCGHIYFPFMKEPLCTSSPYRTALLSLTVGLPKSSKLSDFYPFPG